MARGQARVSNSAHCLPLFIPYRYSENETNGPSYIHSDCSATENMGTISAHKRCCFLRTCMCFPTENRRGRGFHSAAAYGSLLALRKLIHYFTMTTTIHYWSVSLSLGYCGDADWPNVTGQSHLHWHHTDRHFSRLLYPRCWVHSGQHPPRGPE